jgi:hypothetical protein
VDVRELSRALLSDHLIVIHRWGWTLTILPRPVRDLGAYLPDMYK